MGMSQIFSLLIYSKQETCIHEWKLEDKTEKETLYHSTKSWNPSTILLHSSKNIQEEIQKHKTSISSKAYMTIYCFSHQVQPCFTMKAFGINRPK